MLRYLRICCSVACALVCVFFLAWWVRSYWWQDFIDAPVFWPHGCSLASMQGTLMLGEGTRDEPSDTWDFSSIDASSRYATPLFGLGPVFAFHPTDEDGGYIHLPHWFPALITGAIAIVLAKRRRFTLRTLLIAMTIIAIGLAAIAYYATHAHGGGGFSGGYGGLADSGVAGRWIRLL